MPNQIERFFYHQNGDVRKTGSTNHCTEYDLNYVILYYLFMLIYTF